MKTLHAEGIVLKAITFKERDRIVTLFTKEYGVIKLYMRGASLKSPFHTILATPLTVGEYLFTQGRGELLFFSDGNILEQHLGVRDSLEKLQVSHKMLAALDQCQWPEKPAPKLYQLIVQCLAHVAKIDRPEALLPPFLLKILHHEGVLHARGECSTCQMTLLERRRFGAENFCAQHAPHQSLEISAEEEMHLLTMASLRSLQQIIEYPFPQTLAIKVEELFRQFIAN